MRPSRSRLRTRIPKDLAAAIPNQFRNEAPYNTLIGPTQPRTGANGLIIRRGSVIAEWGDTDRADMTFSVTKTFLSTVVGLAFDRGKIRSVTDRVAIYMPKGVDLLCSDHLGTSPAPDERLVRHALGQTGLGRPPASESESHAVGTAGIARARKPLQVQRHAHQRPRPCGVVRPEASAPRSLGRVDHDDDWRFVQLTLGGL